MKMQKRYGHNQKTPKDHSQTPTQTNNALKHVHLSEKPYLDDGTSKDSNNGRLQDLFHPQHLLCDLFKHSNACRHSHSFNIIRHNPLLIRNIHPMHPSIHSHTIHLVYSNEDIDKVFITVMKMMQGQKF